MRFRVRRTGSRSHVNGGAGYLDPDLDRSGVRALYSRGGGIAGIDCRRPARCPSSGGSDVNRPSSQASRGQTRRGAITGYRNLRSQGGFGGTTRKRADGPREGGAPDGPPEQSAPYLCSATCIQAEDCRRLCCGRTRRRVEHRNSSSSRCDCHVCGGPASAHPTGSVLASDSWSSACAGSRIGRHCVKLESIEPGFQSSGRGCAHGVAYSRPVPAPDAGATAGGTIRSPALYPTRAATVGG